MKLLRALAIALYARHAHASTAAALRACEELSLSLLDRVQMQWSREYNEEVLSYWSTALQEVRPACIVFPISANDVATAIKMLNKHKDVRFAVKSGGHSPTPNHSSVESGVLITTSAMVGAKYDKQRQLAYVKPGGKWNDVIPMLEKDGITMLGGRIGIVGVGGLLMQGGVSFLSSQHGLAADNIVEWEIVMADGSIRYIKAKEEPELARALRGGGNQFGIVTQFTTKVYPIGEVWGGTRLYSADKASQIFDAYHNTFKAGEDPKAALILSTFWTPFNIKFFIIFYFYDGPSPPKTGGFAQLLNIPYTTSNTGTKSYSDLLRENGKLPDALNERISFHTATVPWIPDQPQIYEEIRNKFGSLVHSEINLRLISECSISFEPIPATVGKQSQKHGGNALGLTADDPDRMMLAIECAWSSPRDDELFVGLSEELTDWIENKIPEWANGKSFYLPYLMNDAGKGQNATGTYRDFREFKALQAEVDPKGLFRTRTGGFTY